MRQGIWVLAWLHHCLAHGLGTEVIESIKYIYINFKKLLEQNETGFLTAELFRGFHPLMCMDFLRQGAYSMQVYLTSTQTTR